MIENDPLADAHALGLRIEVVDLGVWLPALLISEYDRSARTIRVHCPAVRRVREVLGDRAAVELLRASVAHELYHHGVAEGRIAPQRCLQSCEREAERFVCSQYGIDPAPFERALR